MVGSAEPLPGHPIGDWTVTKNSAVIFDDPGTYDLTPLGGRSVELGTASGPAAIEQTISTEVGRQYQIVFSMSGDWTGGDDAKNVRVSASGQLADFQMTQPRDGRRSMRCGRIGQLHSRLTRVDNTFVGIAGREHSTE